MRILVTGAYGLIGSHIVARLLAEGHELIGTGRIIHAARRRLPDISWVAADLGTTTVEQWVALLDGVEAVVNCAGALQDSPRDDLRAVHVDGLKRLTAACRTAGATKLVHISAAGLAPERASAFDDTKLEAESVLKAADIDWIILRPGLVLGQAAYGGSALLRGLAGFPGVTPIVFGSSLIQLVAVEDVALAVVRALAADAPSRLSIDLLHGEAVTLETLVRELRRWLGWREVPIVRLPMTLARIAAKASDGLAWLGWRSPMRTATLEQLRLGIRGDALAAERALGLKPKSLRQMLNGWVPGVQERWFARLYFVKPLCLTVLCLFWTLSGLIGLARLSDAAAILTAIGISGPLAKMAVIGGSLADIALGLGVAVRRSARMALLGMLLVSAFYMLGGTLLVPGLWLDPLGPFLKTVPAALLALALLAIMDER